MSEQKNLVEVQHLQQYFPAGGMGKNKRYVQAVDDVSFAIRKGETFTAENLTTKRPGDGVSPMRWYEVLGQTAKRDFAEDEKIEL